MAGVTAADVARAAGVSPAAVSRAFRPGGAIAPEVRAKVLSVARDMGYRSPGARMMDQLGTGTISLIAADLVNPFYSMAVESLAHALHGRGMRLMVHAVPPGAAVDSVMAQVLAYRADAAIVTSATLSSGLMRECRKASLPVVLLNRVQPDAAMIAVTCDNYGGARKVAAHLAATGRRRIVQMTGLRDTSTHLERNRGFADGLEEHGLPPPLRIEGGFSHDRAHAAALALFAEGPPPEALFCENDVMALAAMDAARRCGLSVPGDVAVIGFDDIPMAAWDSYRLTTVRQPLARMIETTLELIQGLRAGTVPEGTIRVLPADLILRTSA